MERVVGVVLVALFAFAECVQLHEFYPFGENAGDSELERGDDDAYGPLRLDRPFPYFDTEERSLYVSYVNTKLLNTSGFVTNYIDTKLECVDDCMTCFTFSYMQTNSRRI